MDAEKWVLVLTSLTSTFTAFGVLYNIVISRKVERHTNGLVKTIGDAREAKGLLEGQTEGLAKGRAEKTPHDGG